MSAQGVAQAEALADRLAGTHFDELLTSPRLRAQQTATIIGARLGLTPTVYHELRNVPNGPTSILSLFEVIPFARRRLASRNVLVVSHGGTMLLLLAALHSWPRALRHPQRVPSCQPFACPQETAPGFGGPLLLLLLGSLAALLLAPGAAPGLPTIASFAVAILVYLLMRRLVAAGRALWAGGLLVAIALALVPLAFGPSMQDNRKVLPFNAWAYDLGALLPPLPTPPPNPNGVAAVLAVALALCLAARSSRLRWWSMLALPLLGGALLLTASRAGWLAALAALAFLLRDRILRYARRLVAPAGLVLLLALPALGAAAPGQPSLLSLASMEMRGEQWATSLTLLEQRPLTGLGPGRFAPAYAAAAAASGERSYKTPNNTLLQLWSDAGLLGLLAVAWAAALVVTLSRRLARSPLLDGTIAALIALSVHGLFETNNAIVWASSSGYGYLASPLPFALLGMLAGLAGLNRRKPFGKAAPPGL